MRTGVQNLLQAQKVNPPTPPPGPLLPSGGSYQRTNDIDIAENFARGLGVRFVRFHDPEPAWNDPAIIEEIANNANEALDNLRARGVLEVPSRIETHRKFFQEAGKESVAWAVYIHNPLDLTGLPSNWMILNKAILLNPRPDWVSVAQAVVQRHQGGHLSTSDPHHFVYHEMGHFLWKTDHPRRNPSADQQTLRAALAAVRSHISRQATISPGEFVSEVFAQLVVAVQAVDPQVLALYQQLGGRVI